MATRQIITMDDEHLLRRKSKPIEVFDERLSILASDMIDTMNMEEGVGLAAPQIGILKRVVVCMLDEADIRVFVNPVIKNAQGEIDGLEGCLSIPGKSGNVKRPQSLELSAYTIDGMPVTYYAEGQNARIICHEVDHLDGILYIDRIHGQYNNTK